MRKSSYPLEYGDGVLGKPDRVEDVVVEDALEEVVLVVGLEGRLAGHHLVHEHAQRPPVHAGAVVQLLQDLQSEVSKFPSQGKLICLSYLWGDVVGRATEGGRGHVALDALLAHAEVGNLAVAVRVEQDVVQLEITESDTKK